MQEMIPGSPEFIGVSQRPNWRNHVPNMFRFVCEGFRERSRRYSTTGSSSAPLLESV